MVTYQDLTAAEPSTVDSLAEAWGKVVADYNDASEQLDKNVTAGLSGGYYQGRSIDAASVRSGDLGGHIDAGVEEAKAVKGLVADLADEVETLREKLLKVEKEVLDNPDLRIDLNGVVDAQVTVSSGATVDPMLAHIHTGELTDADWQRIEQAAADVGTYNSKIEKLVSRATALDEETAFKLRAVAETDEKGDVTFNTSPEGSVAAAQTHDLLEKAAKGPLSDAEQTELNRLLKEHNDDPVFATKLMDKLGPENLLKYSGQIALTDDLSDDEIEKFQERMGNTLATATQADPDLAREFSTWVADNAGEDMVLVDPDDEHERSLLTDFAVAPILEHGEYAPEFLVPVAESLMVHNETAAYSTNAGADINPSNSKYLNPFNSALTALGHSPEASVEFFSRDFPVELPNGETFEKHGHDGYLGYVLDNSFSSDQSSPRFSADHAGVAIEAASTGIASDAPEGTPRPEHTEQMTGVTRDLVDYVNANVDDKPDEFNEFKEGRLVDMVDNLGDITANYAEDFYQANVNPEYADKAWVPDSHGESLGLNRLDADGGGNPQVDKWLNVVGYDQGGSAAASGALLAVSEQAAFDASMTDDQSAALRVNDAVEGFGRATGELTEGTTQAKEADAWREYNDNPLVKFRDGVDYVVGKAAGALPGGEVVSDGASYLSGKTVDWIYGSTEAELKADIEKMQDGVVDDSVSEAGQEVNQEIDKMLSNMNLDDPAETKDAILNNLYMSLHGAVGRP
ncbi:MAG: hypothetical protein ACRDXX_07805 [Stackebrandtia sp.]